MLVQRRLRKLLKKQGFSPKSLVMDKLRSYASAFRRLRLNCQHSGGWAETIGPKTHIRRCDDESAKCSGSNRLDRPSVFSACTLPSTPPSTFNAISPRDQRCGYFALRPQTNGGMQSRQRDRASGVRCVLAHHRLS